MNKFIYVFVLIICTQSLAQDTIVVHKDPRIDLLNAKRNTINATTARMSSSGQFKGYRVQILSTRSRDDAFKTKADLLQKFTDQKSYIVFQSPYFRVRIGNFTNKEDAEGFKKSLSAQYPQGIFIVEDLIDYTPSSSTEE